MSILELVTLAAAMGIGVVSLASLALAHLGHFSLTGVASISAVVVLALGLVVARFDRVPVRLDWVGLLPGVTGGVLAAVFFFPGFEYGTGDRDPGAYVEIGSAIARTGRLPFPDELLGVDSHPFVSPGAVWPALWVQHGSSTQIMPQFYHLWSALLASAKDAGHFTGMFSTGPLVGLIAVLLAVAVGRRIAGPAGAWTAALILPTNMLEVWQAKYPSAEIFGQMLFLGSVLAVVLAIRCGWRSAAVAAGLLLGLGYLERADGILMVLFAAVALCALAVAGRFDRRAGWFTAGLVVLLPYGLLQAYGNSFSRGYTLANNIPSLAKLAAGTVALLVVTAILVALRARVRPLLARLGQGRSRLVLGSAYVGVCAILVVLGGLRPILFGKQYAFFAGSRQRTFNEISFIRLFWFFSIWGIALMCAGIAYVGWRRWRFDRWLITIATTGLLTVYCYNLRNSPYLMWSTRRFVTTVVPGIVLLMGLGVAGTLYAARRWVLPLLRDNRVTRGALGLAAAAALVGLAVFGGNQSWPLRSHNENGGSIGVELSLRQLAGSKDGVYLWQASGACCAAPYQLFGGPMFATFGQASALVPSTPVAEAQVIEALVKHYAPAGRPVFYIANGSGRPPELPGVGVSRVRAYSGILPHWAETYTSRPSTTKDYVYAFTVYRLEAS